MYLNQKANLNQKVSCTKKYILSGFNTSSMFDLKVVEYGALHQKTAIEQPSI